MVANYDENNLAQYEDISEEMEIDDKALLDSISKEMVSKNTKIDASVDEDAITVDFGDQEKVQETQENTKVEQIKKKILNKYGITEDEIEEKIKSYEIIEKKKESLLSDNSKEMVMEAIKQFKASKEDQFVQDIAKELVSKAIESIKYDPKIKLVSREHFYEQLYFNNVLEDIVNGFKELSKQSNSINGSLQEVSKNEMFIEFIKLFNVKFYEPQKMDRETYNKMFGRDGFVIFLEYIAWFFIKIDANGEPNKHDIEFFEEILEKIKNNNVNISVATVFNL